MLVVIEYFIKLSISLAVVWLFYQFVLRKLTFYNHNRWYLLVYSLLSFVIPFIDVSPALHQNDLSGSSVVQWVPLVYNKSITSPQFSLWNVVSIIIIAGMLAMLIRLLVQLFSFRRMMKDAVLISEEDIRLYQVNKSITPFSFGNAVFFNKNLHTSEELEKIICHEFIHVKQRHTIDILFSEILCLLNWYNPFAWLIRTAIRQNLEFVADSKVLQNGINKKQYQYLLLKVVGDNQFSIAQKFNFSSLKKRIAMMNKLKTNKKHLLRFLMLLPVLAFVLVSFRKEIGSTISVSKKPTGATVQVKDTVPTPPLPTVSPFMTAGILPDFLKRNPSIKDICCKVDEKTGELSVHISKKDGTKEYYNLANETEKKNAENLYGNLPIPPPPPPPPPANDLPSVHIKFNGKVENVDASLNGPGNPNDSKVGFSKGISDNVLYVLDGNEISKAELDNVEPSTIASIDVLKGNSAIALYGDKAKDGVIVIKTKSSVDTKSAPRTNELKEVVVVGKPISKKIDSAPAPASGNSLKEVVVKGYQTPAKTK